MNTFVGGSRLYMLLIVSVSLLNTAANLLARNSQFAPGFARCGLPVWTVAVWTGKRQPKRRQLEERTANTPARVDTMWAFVSSFAGSIARGRSLHRNGVLFLACVGQLDIHIFL